MFGAGEVSFPEHWVIHCLRRMVIPEPSPGLLKLRQDIFRSVLMLT
jgi:hypothetical protein